MDTVKETPNSSETMSTLSQRVNKAVIDGYEESFKVEGKGLTGSDTFDKKYYPVAEVKIDNFYRFEGYSDPSDNAILYLIQTTDGRKGTLIDAYGAYADGKLSKFIKEVQEIHKKDSHKS
jgi:hypothetical protein